MINETSIQDIRALVCSNKRLGVDPKMETVEVIDSPAQSLPHGNQEPAQGVRLGTAFDLLDPAAFNGQSNRLTEVRRDADIPRPPAEHAIKNKNA